MRCISPVLSFVLLMAMASVSTGADSSFLRPRATFPKPVQTSVGPEHVPGLIEVKFVEGSHIRLRGGRLTTLSGRIALRDGAEEARRLIEGINPLRLERLFSRPEEILEQERRRGEMLSGWELADLNLYYRLILPETVDLETAIDELNALEIVEIAYPVTRPAPAVWLPGGALPGTDDAVSRPARRGPQAAASGGTDGLSGAPLMPTPDFTGQQDYLEDAPTGIEAWHAWGYPGGTGAGVKVIDVEWGWNFSHEDFQSFFFQDGEIDSVETDHGTAVVGEINAQSNGYGVTGIVYDAEVGAAGVGIGFPNAADVYNMAAAALSPGDIFLIEMHMPGPRWDGETQFGYLPMEWNQANFDAIQSATAQGIIVVEAAGNGSQDLDDPLYEGKFDRDLRDSGAIMCGAGKPYSLQAESWSNKGSRVDLHGWGEAVTTTGYGNLYGSHKDEWYTGTFSGTSSASPIVTGAVASFQGIYREARGGVLEAYEVRRLLSDTGSPQQGFGANIGPRPDLERAIDTLLTHTGTLTGTVSDSVSGIDMAGARVEIIDLGFVTHTDSEGDYDLVAYDGLATVSVSAFGHESDTANVSVSVGGVTVHDVVLDRLPWGILEGTVTDLYGRPLPDAEVMVPDLPGGPVVCDSSGYYFVPWLPAGETYLVEVTLEGCAPRTDSVTVEEGVTHVLDIQLAAREGFEIDDGGYVAEGEWEWGEPAGSGPSAAYEGVKCWGTDLDAPYDPSSEYSLYSCPLSLDCWSAASLHLHHWMDTKLDLAGGNIQISTNGGADWTVVVPEEGYHSDSLGVLDGEPGFTGPRSLEGWTPITIDLTDYLESEIMLRFRFASGTGFPSAGWFIDGIYLDGTVRTDVPGEEVRRLPLVLGSAKPNPFRGSVRISLSLAASREIDLAVYDVQGRRVKSLWQGRRAAGNHEVSWSGRDEEGNRVAPGIYFVRLNDGENTAVRRLALVR